MRNAFATVPNTMPAPGFATVLAKPIVIPGTAFVADASGSKGVRFVPWRLSSWPG